LPICDLRQEEISHEATKSQSQLDIDKKQNDSSGLGVLVAENNRRRSQIDNRQSQIENLLTQE
jgi:hypothetical protein